MTDSPIQKRVLLLASAHSYRAKPFLAAARRMGVDVVRGVDVPPPMIRRSASALPLDFQDVPRSAQTIAELAERHPMHAIIPADDSATLLAAHAASLLGLPHNSPDAALAARDKFVMRQRLAAAGMRVPEFRRHTLDEDPARVARAAPYPCVLKPLTLSGSRGVIRADDADGFVKAWARLRAILESVGSDEYLVEGFIPGREVALEGVLDRGALTVLALFDKPDPLEGPYFEETIYVTPSRLPVEVQWAIAECAEAGARALGLSEGPAHAELRVNESGPWILEIAGRSIGGLCSQTLRFGTDLSLEELILRQALGMEILSLQREGRAAGVMMIPIPRSGILMDVRGCDDAMNVTGVEAVEIAAKPRTLIRALPEGESYLGFMVARGETPGEVEASLREAHRRLTIMIEPEIPVL